MATDKICHVEPRDKGYAVIGEDEESAKRNGSTRQEIARRGSNSQSAESRINFACYHNGANRLDGADHPM